MPPRCGSIGAVAHSHLAAVERWAASLISGRSGCRLHDALKRPSMPPCDGITGLAPFEIMGLISSVTQGHAAGRNKQRNRRRRQPRRARAADAAGVAISGGHGVIIICDDRAIGISPCRGRR